jgi:hypothetical protein
MARAQLALDVDDFLANPDGTGSVCCTAATSENTAGGS